MLATIFIDRGLYELVLKHWAQAWVTVKAPRPQRRGNRYMQAGEWDSSLLDFPFEIRLAEVTEWDKDAPVAVDRKRWLTEQEEDEMEEEDTHREQREEDQDRRPKRTRQEAEEEGESWGNTRGSSSTAWGPWS